MMDEQNILLGTPEIFQTPDPRAQCRIDVLGENIGFEAKVLQYRLHKEHTIRDGIGDGRPRMELVNTDFVLTSHNLARPRRQRLIRNSFYFWDALSTARLSS
jgi:hypothetical protein